MAYLPPVIAALVAVLILPGLLFYYDVTPKVALVCLGTCAILMPGIRGLDELRRRALGEWFVRLAVLEAASLLLATIFSEHVALSVGGSNWRRFGLVTHVAAILFAVLAGAVLARDTSRLRDWLAIFCGAGLITSIYGCAQYFGIDPLLDSSGYHVGEGEWSIVRPPSTLGHAGYAAAFYLHAISAGVALPLVDPRPAVKWFGIMTALIGSAATVLSGTRGAMVGWVVGAVLLAYWLRPQLRRWHAFAAVVMLTAAVGFYFSPAGQMLRSRVRWSSEDQYGGGRPLLWRDSLRMGTARWATGWGREVFSTEFPRFQSRELARAFPDFYHESPHNIFLDALTAQGVLGLAVLLGFCVLAARTARHSAVQSVLCAGLASAVISQLFLSFTAPTALWFYLTLALVVALETPAPETETKHLPAILFAPVFVILACYGVQLSVADRLLQNANRQLQVGRLAEAAATYERARWWQPWGTNSDLWFSRAAVEAAQKSGSAPEAAKGLQAAAQAAVRATDLAEDRHNAFYSLSAICALRNDFTCVEKSLRSAIAVAPNWFKPHWTLARVLAAARRNSEAQVEAVAALDLDGGKHAEVGQTLADIMAKK